MQGATAQVRSSRLGCVVLQPHTYTERHSVFTCKKGLGPCTRQSRSLAKSPFNTTARRSDQIRVATRDPEVVESSSATLDFELKAAKKEPLNWYKQWYPLAIIEDLDPRKPHPIKLLDMPIVMWQGPNGKWNAFEDRCPHRSAALSCHRLPNTS
jgi:hypothetical protein